MVQKSIPVYSSQFLFSVTLVFPVLFTLLFRWKPSQQTDFVLTWKLAELQITNIKPTGEQPLKKSWLRYERRNPSAAKSRNLCHSTPIFLSEETWGIKLTTWCELASTKHPFRKHLSCSACNNRGIFIKNKKSIPFLCLGVLMHLLHFNTFNQTQNHMNNFVNCSPSTPTLSSAGKVSISNACSLCKTGHSAALLPILMAKYSTGNNERTKINPQTY